MAQAIEEMKLWQGEEREREIEIEDACFNRSAKVSKTLTYSGLKSIAEIATSHKNPSEQCVCVCVVNERDKGIVYQFSLIELFAVVLHLVHSSHLAVSLILFLCSFICRFCSFSSFNRYYFSRIDFWYFGHIPK